MSKSSSVDIPKDYTVAVGGTGSTIQVDADLDNIRIKELAPINVNSNVAVTQPIVTQSSSTSDSKADINLKVDPLKVTSDSTSAIDVKPLAIDSCQTLKLAPLPPIKMEQPYSQHFGITLMGMELWGINVSGKSEMCLHSPTKPKHYSVQIPRSCEHCGEPTLSKADSPRPRSGLRVRVK